MANKYYDLGLASGGSGTTGDPYGLAEWITDVGTMSGDTLYTKGVASEVINSAVRGIVRPWYTDQPNGVDAPWRISLNSDIRSGRRGTTIIAPDFSGGIIEIIGSRKIQSSGVLNFNNMYVHATSPNTIYYISPSAAGLNFNGCIIVSPTKIEFDLGATNTIATVKDSMLISNNISVVTCDSGDILNFLNCATSAASISHLGVTLVDTGSQYSWTPPTMPAWNDPKSAFNSSILSVGINTPPEPGTSPYTDYEKGLWNTARTGIGAMDFVSVAPVASFNYNPSTGYTPLTVDFTSTSTGTISNYLFSFGDGTTSADASTSHTYVVTTPTYFTPSLTAMGPDGTDSTSVTNGVHVLVPAPVAGFTYAPHSGDSPLTVAFTNTSTGIVTTNAWTFGDGTSSSSASPSHTYIDTVTEDKTVTQTVTGPGGSDHTSAIVHIGGVAAPVITSNPTSTTVVAGSSLTLSVTAVGVGLTYSWLKNGVIVAGQTTSVFSKMDSSSSDAGSYLCHVSNAEGAAVSLPASVIVQDSLYIFKGLNQIKTNKVGKVTVFSNGSARADIVSYPGN